MFERFTDRARRTVVLAQEEARLLRHNYIGTEHLLLGLLAEADGVAARALRQLGVSLGAVRAEVAEIIGEGGSSPSGHIPFTPRAKKVMELSLREAISLGHNHIGTEHILLGLVREGEGVAAQVLVKLGADLPRVRRQVMEELGNPRPGRPPGLVPRRRTPGAEEAVAAAEQLAGTAPMGTHHLLEALARSEESMAARVLAALGVDAEAVAGKIDELSPEGTTDITLEEAAARQMELRVEGEEVHLVLRDPATVELARRVSDSIGHPVRGDDPVAGSFVGLWSSVQEALDHLRHHSGSPETEESDAEPGSRSALVQRAIQSRLRRRKGPGQS